MTGADGTYDYKAMAAGIVLAGGEGMGNLLPVVEKELLHYRILDAMMREGFFSSLVFQGGTSLRLCHGSPRYSEDLDFAGGTSFDMDTLKGLGSCISDSLSGMGDDVTVRVKEPRPDADGLTRRWRIAIRTAGQRKDLPSQTIKLERTSRSIVPPWSTIRCSRPCRVRSSSMWKAPPRFLPTSCSPMPAHRTCGDATCGTCAGWRREATSIPDGRWSLRN